MRRRLALLQLVCTVRGLHSHGLVHGGLSPDQIRIFAKNPVSTAVCLPFPKHALSPIDPQQAAMRWVNREISNHEYLMMLNHLCGRRIQDPQMHPIFPWVINFQHGAPELHNPSWPGWIDLTKSKYRLTKGDHFVSACGC